MADPKSQTGRRCGAHEELTRDLTTIKTTAQHILDRINAMHTDVRDINGRVRANETEIALLKGSAYGAGAVAGMVVSVLVSLACVLLQRLWE